MRKYEPIWLALKQRRTVSIQCSKSLQSRIIKAVIKEKDMDKEHKEIHCDRLYTHRTDNTVHFELVKRLFK